MAKLKCYKFIAVILFLSLSVKVFSGADEAWNILQKNKGNPENYPKVVRELIQDRFYYAAIPFIKEYLTVQKTGATQEIDKLIDQIVTEVGIMQFEVLPISILSRTKAPMVRYILAKKKFHSGKYKETLSLLGENIPREHPAKPFSLLLEGSAQTLLKQYKSALSVFEECINLSDKNISRFGKDIHRRRQLNINRDYCLVGMARVHFSNGNFENAGLAYLDLPKSSHVWPEVLFEEAWSSFYERDYNRTLGKLVTYNAPIMNFVFNPEIDVLKALTYLELCLYDDANKVVNDFYTDYQDDFKSVSEVIKKNGQDYKYFYLISKAHMIGKARGSRLLTLLLNDITRDAAFRELYDAFQRGKEEIKKVRGKEISSSKMRGILSSTLKESLLLQRDLVGAYVRKRIIMALEKINTSFQGMSFIKLEVLSLKKLRLYQSDSVSGTKRGDIKNIKRNDKQYFWNFNGEFWADELGDYVFSLKSSCGPNKNL